MKVIFFDFIVNYGGAPQGSAYLMKRLKDKKIDVGIVDGFGVCSDYINYLKENDISFDILDSRKDNLVIGGVGKFTRFLNIIKQIPMYFNLMCRLYISLKKQKSDIVIVNNEKSLFFISLFKLVFNYKIILYFRGEGTKSQLHRRFLKNIDKNVDHILTHSMRAYRNFRALDFNSKDITYLPNCIELEKFQLPLKNNDFNLKNNNFKIILASARPVREKGHHTAIEALNILHEKGYRVDLIIPGVMPMGSNDDFYNYLINKINEYDLSNFVHFIGWRKNLIGDIVNCDAVVLPSHTEGFPRVIIEAMAQGIPVCATPVGGIPEAIIHNETGMISQVDNAQELAENLEKFILDQQFYNKISSGSKVFAINNFHPDLNTKVVLETLSHIA